MSSVLAIQNPKASKKVLPLILNSKNKIFRTYPILAGLTYKEFKVGIHTIAEEIKALTGNKSKSTPETLHIILESMHSGKLSNLYVHKRSSIKWLEEKARSSAGVKDKAEVGALEKLSIRWVLVDVRAEAEWKRLSASEMVKIKALVKSSAGFKASYRNEDRLEDIGVYDGIIFHLYAIPEVELNIKQDTQGHSGGGSSGFGRNVSQIVFKSVVWHHPPEEEEEDRLMGGRIFGFPHYGKRFSWLP
jgi:hypothetical protein